MPQNGAVQRRVLGLVGGLSWESSALYYRLLNEEMGSVLGGHHNARSVLVTVDFEDVLKFALDGDWDGVGEILASAAIALERAGADCVMLTANTAHIVADRVEAACPLPLLHIADAVGKTLRDRRFARLGLIGTRQTLGSGLYDRVMAERYGIEVVLPGDPEQDVLQQIILEELTRGQIRSQSRDTCIEIIAGLASKGAQGVIVGCTELPLLLSDVETAVPQFDTTRLHVAQAVSFALGEG